MRSPTLARGRLSTAGSAADPGCSGLARVQVAVTDPVEHGCRFLGPNGEFGPVADCAHPYALIAAGGTRWSLELEGVRLPEDAEAAIWGREHELGAALRDSVARPADLPGTRRSGRRDLASAFA